MSLFWDLGVSSCDWCCRVFVFSLCVEVKSFLDTASSMKLCELSCLVFCLVVVVEDAYAQQLLTDC